MYRYLHVPLLINLHQRIGRFSPLLSGIGEASRIDRQNTAFIVHDRAVYMPLQHHLVSPGHSLLFQKLVAHGNVVVVPVRDKRFIGTDLNFHITF